MAAKIDYNWLVQDPIRVIQACWPQYPIYDKQIETVYSVRDNVKTFVPAGNKLGKDFITGMIAVGAFLFPNTFLRRPCEWIKSQEVRIVTTSVKDNHLRILWGEIERFIQQSRIPLLSKQGGPLIFNHHYVRKRTSAGLDPISYLWGMVSEKGEGMAGHHGSNTLVIGDEASGIDQKVYDFVQRWAKRQLWIGNCNPCGEGHFFRAGVEGGDILRRVG